MERVQKMGGSKPMKPTFIISAEATLSDSRALLDSYAVELRKDGVVMFCGPLHFCEMTETGRETSWDVRLGPDPSLDLRLVRYEPPAEDDFLEGIRERATRWPFYVHEPLIICLSVDEQWWQWTFTPGKVYEERRFDGTEKLVRIP